MILRAAFWIALVSFFMPHEPDLGFGRPGAAPASIASLIPSVPDTHVDCSAHQDACAGGLSIIDGFQSYAVRSLDAVRADIEAHRTPLR
ncbi:MAG: hypothetical protein JSR60_14540 [Proteobacteria bacterium]|nr:hypothetical protein [Pseudomonadota bacterium]